MKVFDKKIWNNSEGYGTGSSSQGGVLKIVNNGSNDVEIYYEIDKTEYGNTTVAAGSTVDVNLVYFGDDGGYYIRYLSGGENNTHHFSGTYRGNSETVEIGFYDGNICPPGSYSITQWDFLEGDGGTVTIDGPTGPQYTLHYALGSYADSHDEDKLPSDVTASEGSTVNIDFSTYPAPASEGYDFVGWATSDGQNVPDFSESGTTEITLYSNVTLYPAYAVHIASDYLAINNNYGSSSILVQWYDEDKATWKSSTEVSAGGYEDFEYTPGREYRLSFSSGTYQPCVFTGDLDGASYINEACHEYVDGIINAPYDTKWIFTSGVSYLTVQQVTQRTLTYNMGQYADGGSVPSSVTVNDGTTVNIEFSPNPTRTGFRFIGWATSDDAVSADYAQGYTTSVQMFSDIDLYPVFEVVSSNDPQVYFDFTGMGGNDQIDIKVLDNGDWISYDTVSGSKTVTFTAGSSYKFNTTGISSSISEAYYNGTFYGVPYTDALVYNTPDMYDPTRTNNVYIFSSGDSGTITFSVK